MRGECFTSSRNYRFSSHFGMRFFDTKSLVKFFDIALVECELGVQEQIVLPRCLAQGRDCRKNMMGGGGGGPKV